MDNLKDIFNSFKDRFTNPLIFSFGCSWIFINWQIVTALFFFDSKQIDKTAFKTVFDFINDKINITYCFWHPLLFAIGYTFLMPIIKNYIRAFYSWAAKWGDNWNLKIQKGGQIPIEKYFGLRDNYDKRTKILEDIIAKENEYSDKYDTMNTQLLETKATVNELTQKLTEKENFERLLFDVRMLNGYWTNTYSGEKSQTQLQGSEEIYIQDGEYYLLGRFAEKILVFKISNFVFDYRNKVVFFIKDKVNQQEYLKPPDSFKYNINILRFENDDFLSGRENGEVQIAYRRKVIGIEVADEKTSHSQ